MGATTCGSREQSRMWSCSLVCSQVPSGLHAIGNNSNTLFHRPCPTHSPKPPNNSPPTLSRKGPESPYATISASRSASTVSAPNSPAATHWCRAKACALTCGTVARRQQFPVVFHILVSAQYGSLCSLLLALFTRCHNQRAAGGRLLSHTHCQTKQAGNDHRPHQLCSGEVVPIALDSALGPPGLDLGLVLVPQVAALLQQPAHHLAAGGTAQRSTALAQ